MEMAQRRVTRSEALADAPYRQALVELLYQLADDDLVIGHRASEWLGLAPHIEEDVAFSSIAQDEVGHAALYLTLLSELEEGGPDALAFSRPARSFRNAVILERPNGTGSYRQVPVYDWVRAVLRHYLYDTFEAVRLAALVGSSYEPLAQAATKISREEYYHRLHGATWLKRLAGGGTGARDRVAQALIELWPEVGGLCDLGPMAAALIDQAILPVSAAGLLDQWAAAVQADLAACGLLWPGQPLKPALDGRCGGHSPDLDALLETMSEVYRLDPAASW